MGIIITLILGGIVGWLAAAVMGRDEGLFGSVVIGIVGSLIGGFVSQALMGSNQSYLQFSWMSLLWAFIGSVILVALLNMWQGRRGVVDNVSHRG